MKLKLKKLYSRQHGLKTIWSIKIKLELFTTVFFEENILKVIDRWGLLLGTRNVAGILGLAFPSSPELDFYSIPT